MKKNRKPSLAPKSSVFVSSDGKTSSKPMEASVFGETRILLDGLDSSREYAVFREANSPSSQVVSNMKEIFDN